MHCFEAESGTFFSAWCCHSHAGQVFHTVCASGAYSVKETFFCSVDF